MVLLRFFRAHLKPEIYGPGYKGFFKQAFVEHPIYLFSTSAVLLTGILIPYNAWRWNKMQGQKRRFMNHYTIMRPNDPNLHLYHYLDVNDKNNIIDSAKQSKYDVD